MKRKHFFSLFLVAVGFSQSLLLFCHQAQERVPQRVISTAPSITEMLFALGEEDRLVGVTSYCDYPAEAKEKPVIGDFASPSMEAVLLKRPDLIIVLSDRDDLLQKLAPLGTPILVLGQENLKGILDSIKTLGTTLGCSEKAEKLTSEIRNDLSQISQRISPLPRKKALFLVGRNLGSLTDLYAAGKDSYLGELLQMAGGENIFDDLPGAYPKVSIEQLLVRNPEVIFDMSHGDESDPGRLQAARAVWATFPGIAAVREDRVHILRNDIFLVPGPRVAQAVRELAEVIHGVEFVGKTNF